MNPDQIDRLAAMGNSLRPDWPIPSLKTFLTKNLQWRAYGDVAVALAWVASKTDTDTPRLLLEQKSACWKAALADSAGDENLRRPPRKDEECATHPGEYAPPICRCCAADKRARRDEATEAEREHARMTARDALAAARAEIRKNTTAEENAT